MATAEEGEDAGITDRDAQTLLLMRRLPREGMRKVHDALQTLENHGLSQVEDITSLREAVGQALLPQQHRPKAADPVCWIDKTEERGITVSQVRDVYCLIKENCSDWREDFKGNPNFGKALEAKEVNLYQTVNNVIKPRTKKYKCSYVELVATGPTGASSRIVALVDVICQGKRRGSDDSVPSDTKYLLT